MKMTENNTSVFTRDLSRFFTHIQGIACRTFTRIELLEKEEFSSGLKVLVRCYTGGGEYIDIQEYDSALYVDRFDNVLMSAV